MDSDDMAESAWASMTDEERERAQSMLDRMGSDQVHRAATEARPLMGAYLAALAEAIDPAKSYFATTALPRLLLGPRNPSARQYRVRLHTDPVHGPHWLTLLAVCAWLRGGIIGSAGVDPPTS